MSNRYFSSDACAEDFAAQLSEGLGQTCQANRYFSVIIAKATVDAVLSKKDGIRDVEILFNNAYSALREDGIFVIICLQENTKILYDTLKKTEKWEVELCEIGLYHTGKKYSYTGNSAHPKYCSEEAKDFSKWRFSMLILSKKGHSHNTENGLQLRLVQHKIANPPPPHSSLSRALSLSLARACRISLAPATSLALPVACPSVLYLLFLSLLTLTSALCDLSL
jgi:hypothetical protein